MLARLGEIDGYLRELQQVAPDSFEAYQAIATRRACERILQVAIEAVIDTCALLVSGLRLGVPGDEEDLIAKLEAADVLSKGTAETLRSMKGFRNILVHQYGQVDDRIVYEKTRTGTEDFERFKAEVLEILDAPGD